LTIDILEDEDHYRDYKTDTFVRPKQAIYWPNLVTTRKRGIDKYLPTIVGRYLLPQVTEFPI